MNPPPVFTIARIAQELGRSRQHVYLRFADIRRDGETFVRGQPASGWLTSSFSPDISEKLESIRIRKHFRSIDDLLSAPPSRYKCSVPLAAIAPAAREKAFKLREALRPFLRQRDSADVLSEDFVRRGVENYRLIFGYKVSSKTWRAKFSEAVDRDAEYREWDRLDLYLPEKPGLLSTGRPILIAREHSLEILEETIAELVRRAPLDVELKDRLWTKSCDQLQLTIEEGANAKKAKREILTALLGSGLLGTDKETVRRNLNHHWQQFVARDGKPFVDRRRLKPKDHLPEEERNKIVGAGLNRNLTTAWRDSIEDRRLSVEEQERYSGNAGSVPNRIRRACGPRLASIAHCAKDSRSERADGPSHIGDYSGLFAGEKFEMDDWTPECLYHDYLPNGLPRFIQGQIITLIDVASRRVLQFSFTEGAYSALQIRATLTRACSEYCLPDLLNIEKGLWKRAKLIVGNKAIGDSEWEMGVREFMKVNHAKRPQAKATIEKFFDQLGMLMRRLPAWCGPDMRKMSRDLHRRVALAESGKVDPRTVSLSKEQMIDAISECIAEYNATPQPHSKVTGGLSPNDAWNVKQSPNGRPSLGTEAGYLLAYHREPVTIRKCQIVKRIGRAEHVYHSPQTARFDRQRVLLWWNPEDLDQVAFSSLDRKEGPFIVPRQEETPVLANPDYAAIGRNQAKIDETLKARRVIYRACQPWMVKIRLRPTLTDHSTAAFGEKLETEVAIVKEKQSKKERTVARAKRLARSVGLRVNADEGNAEGIAAAAELLREVYPTPNEDQ